MAEIARGTALAPPRRRFDRRDLSRVAAWGLIALGALTLATYAASSDIGEDRLILAIAGIRGVPPPERLARTPSESQARQLAEAVRDLSADRNQLLARLETIERNVGDMTGSIARIAAAPPAATIAATPWPAPSLSAPEAKPAPVAPAQASAPANAVPDIPIPRPAAPPPPDDTATAKPEFGVDLGRANSVEGLRQLWTTVRGRHGAALEGLRPIVTIRELARSGGVEIRLVAGPIPNAAAAARLCATLPGVTCHPTLFDGQRLALR